MGFWLRMYKRNLTQGCFFLILSWQGARPIAVIRNSTRSNFGKQIAFLVQTFTWERNPTLSYNSQKSLRECFKAGRAEINAKKRKHFESMFQAKHFKVLPIKANKDFHYPITIVNLCKYFFLKKTPKLLGGVTSQAVLIAAAWEFKSLGEELRKSCNCWLSSQKGNCRWLEQGLALNKMVKSHRNGLRQVLFPSVKDGGTKSTISWVLSRWWREENTGKYTYLLLLRWEKMVSENMRKQERKNNLEGRQRKDI